MNNYRYRMCCNNEKDNNQIEIQDNKNDIIDPRQSCAMVNNNQNQSNNCACGFNIDETSVFPSNPMYGQSYVPIQQMKKVFNPETGLKMGTIYPELVSPYSPCQSIREIEFLKSSNEIGEGCNG